MTTERATPRVVLAVSSLSAGGAERTIAELANAWAGKGWNVAVLTLSSPGEDHYALDPRVERIGLALLWDSVSLWHSVASNFRRSRAIRDAVLKRAPDVVVSFIEQTNVRVLVSLIGSGIPVIVSERIDPRRHPMTRGWTLARRLAYALARRLVVQTEAVARWAAKVVPAARVRTVPNFVRAMPVSAEGRRNPRDILAVGRLARQKGFDLLIRALALTGLAGDGVRLTILGDGSERENLARLAAELGIAHSVSMPGVVKDPENWMARCAVFVLPSRYEGFPNALLEAMAMGCPAIAADCDSGPREIVRQELDGLLVPPENVEALAGALAQLMTDGDLRARLGARAMEVRDRFSRDRVLAEWEAVICEVLRERKGQRHWC